MTVLIAQVISNTNYPVAYRNTKTAYTYTIQPKTQADQAAKLIPSSEYKANAVPYAGEGPTKYVELTVGNSTPYKIQDESYKLSVYDYPDPANPTAGVKSRVGSLVEGQQWVICLDEVLGKGETKISATFYLYKTAARNQPGLAIAPAGFVSAAALVDVVPAASFLFLSL